MVREEMEKTLELYRLYKRRLNDLSSANRNLLLLRLSKNREADLKESDFLFNRSAEDVVWDLVKGKKSVMLCSELDARMFKNNELSHNLKLLYRNHAKIKEETGENDLYVAYPWVEGAFSNGVAVRSPLLYFPYNLQLSNGEWKLQRRAGEKPHFNGQFLLAYSQANKVKLPNDFFEQELDFAEEPRVWLTELYQLMKSIPLEIHFNSELFTEKIQSFTTHKTQAFKDQQKSGQLKLQPLAVFGLFPQSDSFISSDYEELLEKELPLPFQDSSEKTESGINYIPLEIDGTQERVLEQVAKGKSIVVQGPPGTGKSQLIANIIADQLAKNKKVLFVCQKRVALDVVYERLEKVGIQEFIALVHDFATDRSALYQQIQRQIQQMPYYQEDLQISGQQNAEENYQRLHQQIHHWDEEFLGYKRALFSKDEYGISPKAIYLLRDKSIATKKGDYSIFRLTELQNDLSSFRYWLSLYRQNLSDNTGVKKRRNSIEGKYSKEELKEFISKKINLLEEIERKKWGCGATKLVELEKPIAEYFEAVELLVGKDKNSQLGVLKSLLKNEEENKQTLENDLSFLEVMGGFAHWECEEYELELVKEWALKNPLLFKWKWGVILLAFADSKKKQALPILKRLNKNFEKEVWGEDLIVAIEKQLTLLKIKKDWTIKELLPFFSEEIKNEDFDSIKIKLELAKKAQEKKLVLEQVLTDPEEVWAFNLLSEKKKIGGRLKELENLENRYFRKLGEEGNSIQSLISFQELVDSKWNLWREIDQNELEIGKEKVEVFYSMTSFFQFTSGKIGDVTNKDLEKNLEQSIYEYYLEEIEKKYPELQLPSQQRFSFIKEELRRTMPLLNSLAKEVVQKRLKEKVLENEEYNRTGKLISYRELLHQVSKKRMIWPIRKLIQTYRDELFTLLPCWMTSPETVSALFPVEDVFDVVIFDEASQCFAEKGLASAFRGKQLVVAGDSQQLRPTNMFAVRYDEEDESEDPEKESESFLELSSLYLESEILTGHYRSQMPELIAFSNQHFYNNKLIQTPALEQIKNYEPAMKYSIVEGVWEKGGNLKEAEAIIRELKALQNQSIKKSIGIITFNSTQQNLLLDLLETSWTNGSLKYDKELFVKNIENVQGDERDIILFSLGYGPDKVGKFRMNFGPLNLEGGENRLNVAITRAKYRLHVFASVLPHQFEVEHLKHRGPKLLKGFVEFVLQVSQNGYPFEHKELSLQNENSLKKVWNEKGYPLLRFSDLGEPNWKDNGKIYLTDDERFLSSPSGKDWLVYKYEHFKKLGWDLDYLFSSVEKSDGLV